MNDDEKLRIVMAGLDPHAKDAVLRDMAVLARVKSAKARGMVIIEMSKELFEKMAEVQAPEGYTHRVEWTTDELGFAAPVVYREEAPDAR